MFNRQIDVRHQHDINCVGVEETANGVIAVKLDTSRRFLLESAVWGRDAAYYRVRMRRIVLDNFLQPLRMGSPPNHQDSLPKPSRNGFLPQIAEKQTTPGIKPGHCRDRG